MPAECPAGLCRQRRSAGSVRKRIVELSLGEQTVHAVAGGEGILNRRPYL